MTTTITKQYHFSAAHRNELLDDKCSNIHGHTYHLEIEFLMDEADEAGVTMLFSEIDRNVEPVIKQLDHSFIIHRHDPFISYLMGKTRLCVLSVPTSCENLAAYIIDRLKENSQLPRIFSLSLQETTSSTVTLTP